MYEYFQKIVLRKYFKLILSFEIDYHSHSGMPFIRRGFSEYCGFLNSKGLVFRTVKLTFVEIRTKYSKTKDFQLFVPADRPYKSFYMRGLIWLKKGAG